MRHNFELGETLAPLGRELSRLACLTRALDLQSSNCTPDDLPGGAYGTDLNTIVRTLEDGRGAVIALTSLGVLAPIGISLAAEETLALIELLEASEADVRALTPPEELRADHELLLTTCGTPPWPRRPSAMQPWQATCPRFALLLGQGPWSCAESATRSPHQSS